MGRNRWVSITALFGVAAVVVAFAGCGNGDSRRADGQAGANDPTTAIPREEAGTADKGHVVRSSFRSFAEFEMNTEFIFRGTATNRVRQAVNPGGPISYTVTDVTVEEVLKGDPSLVGSTVAVRQMDADETIPILTSATQYVLFTNAAPFAQEEPKTQYWPLGAFSVGADSVLSDIDPLSRLSASDKKIRLEDLRRAIVS